MENNAAPTVHAFEVAGLGIAPFEFVDMHDKGGTCQYCGRGIKYVCMIEDSRGAKAWVGSDCVRKTYDRGLIQSTTLAISSAKKRVREEKKEIARAALRAERKAAREQAFSVFCSDKGGLLEDLQADHPITKDILARGLVNGYITESQIALVRRLANEVRNPKPVETNVPAPEGKVTFEGECVSLKWVPGYMGGSNVAKITVKVSTPSGVWLAWGTCPESLFWNKSSEGASMQARTVKGCKVRITATLKPGRDAHFAIMSRPRGEVIQEAL